MDKKHHTCLTITWLQYNFFLLILMFMFRVCFYSSAVHSPTEGNIKRCMTFTLWMKISKIFGFLYTTLVKNITWCSFFFIFHFTAMEILTLLKKYCTQYLVQTVFMYLHSVFRILKILYIGVFLSFRTLNFLGPSVLMLKRL